MTKYYVIYERGSSIPFKTTKDLRDARRIEKERGIEYRIQEVGFQGYLIAGNTIRENRQNKN
jgi:hypothetical protein